MANLLLRTVSQTSFDTPLFESYFDNTNVSVPNVVLRDTARVLLSKRIPANDTVLIRQCNDGFPDDDDNLAFVRVRETHWEEFRKHFLDNGFKLAEDITAMLKTILKRDIEVYMDVVRDPENPKQAVDTKHTVIMSTYFDTALYHMAAMLLSRLLDGYFVEQPLTDEEKARLLKALQSDTTNEFTKWIADYAAAQTDVYDMFIQKSLTGFESALGKKRIESLKQSIAECDSQLRSLMRSIRNVTNEKRDHTTALRGYMTGRRDTNELWEFFKSNKNLYLVSTDQNDQALSFWAWCWFDGGNPESTKFIFDREYDEAYVDVALDNLPGEYSVSDVRKFFKALFIDRTIRIRLASYVTLTYGDTRYPLEYFRNGDNEPPVVFEPKHLLFNPHHYHHHCPGSNEQAIAELLAEGSYTDMVAQMIAAAGQVNVDEAPTMEPFIADLCSSDNPVYYVKARDEWMTISEVMEYLIEEDK